MFDYATIRAQWSAYPPLRMAYGEDETGYGRVLDTTHVCIANLPLTGGLMLYDIVTLDRAGGRFRRWTRWSNGTLVSSAAWRMSRRRSATMPPTARRSMPGSTTSVRRRGVRSKAWCRASRC